MNTKEDRRSKAEKKIYQKPQLTCYGKVREFSQAAIMNTKGISSPTKSKKKIYQKPQLTCYGKVSELTQGGSGVKLENSAGKPASRKSATSDRRAKESIVRVGTHPSGFGLYLFRYKPEFEKTYFQHTYFGVMADEVETVIPEAVSTDSSGYKMVNYQMLQPISIQEMKNYIF